MHIPVGPVFGGFEPESGHRRPPLRVGKSGRQISFQVILHHRYRHPALHAGTVEGHLRIPGEAVQPEGRTHQPVKLGQDAQPVFLLDTQLGVELDTPFGIPAYIEYAGHPAGRQEPDASRADAVFQRHADDLLTQPEVVDRQPIEMNLDRPEFPRTGGGRSAGCGSGRQAVQLDGARAHIRQPDTAVHQIPDHPAAMKAVHRQPDAFIIGDFNAVDYHHGGKPAADSADPHFKVIRRAQPLLQHRCQLPLAERGLQQGRQQQRHKQERQQYNYDEFPSLHQNACPRLM